MREAEEQALDELLQRGNTLRIRLGEAFASAGWTIETYDAGPPTASFADPLASTTLLLNEELIVEASSGSPDIIIQRLNLAGAIHRSALRRFQAGKG